MSPMRAVGRRLEWRFRYQEIDPQPLVLVACLCVSLFVLFFAMGRLSSPKSVRRERTPHGVGLQQAGIASLEAAPAVELGRLASVTLHRKGVPAKGKTTTSATVRAGGTPVTTVTRSGGGSAPVSQPKAPAVSRPSPSASKGGSKRTSPSGGGGTSFDTSG